MRRIAQWLFVGLLVFPGTVLGQAVDEYSIKAAFIYNFTKFIEWPNASGLTSFAICVLGDDPFGSSLDQLVKGKAARGVPIQVRRLRDAAEARECQVVFVKREEEAKAQKLVEAIRGFPVLTVGEFPKFGNGEGMISLSMKDDRVVITIDTKAVESSGLKVSAKLMTLAKSSRNP